MAPPVVTSTLPKATFVMLIEHVRLANAALVPPRISMSVNNHVTCSLTEGGDRPQVRDTGLSSVGPSSDNGRLCHIVVFIAVASQFENPLPFHVQ
jgi:hypothetical protein